MVIVILQYHHNLLDMKEKRQIEIENWSMWRTWHPQRALPVPAVVIVLDFSCSVITMASSWFWEGWAELCPAAGFSEALPNLSIGLPCICHSSLSTTGLEWKLFPWVVWFRYMYSELNNNHMWKELSSFLWRLVISRLGGKEHFHLSEGAMPTNTDTSN